MVEPSATDREVIDTLKLDIPETEQFMHRIIEKASNAGSGNTGCLRLQVEELTDHAALPKEPFIEPGSMGIQGRPESGDHTEAERAVPGDILGAAKGLGDTGQITRLQEIERQIGRAIGWGFPAKVSMGRSFEIGPRAGLSNQ